MPRPRASSRSRGALVALDAHDDCFEGESSVDTVNSASDRPLRPGDVVEVKSPSEIFATLDGDAIDHMPFMAEMLAHAGRRYTVSRRVDNICDTVTSTGSRRMESTVYLDDLRCDGSAHGGCQAACISEHKHKLAPSARMHNLLP